MFHNLAVIANEFFALNYNILHSSVEKHFILVPMSNITKYLSHVRSPQFDFTSKL